MIWFTNFDTNKKPVRLISFQAKLGEALKLTRIATRLPKMTSLFLVALTAILEIVKNFLGHPAEDISITCQRCWIWPPLMRHMTFSAAKGSHNTATIWVVLAASIACLGWVFTPLLSGDPSRERQRMVKIHFLVKMAIIPILIYVRELSSGVLSLVFQNPLPCEPIFVTP